MLRNRLGFENLVKNVQLTMLPPYLVCWEVNNISSKTVSKDIL